MSYVLYDDICNQRLLQRTHEAYDDITIYVIHCFCGQIIELKKPLITNHVLPTSVYIIISLPRGAVVVVIIW